MPPSLPLSTPAWGKLGRDGKNQSLIGHGRDVAAVFIALCRLKGIRHRLCRLAGVDALAEAWIDRLGWFVFLHDLGKANTGFQARRDPGAPPVGHVAPILGEWANISALVAPRIDGWGDTEALTDWFHAVLSHHGKPWVSDPEQSDPDLSAAHGKHWLTSGGYDPRRELLRLCRAADAAFPLAFSAAPPLPFTAPLVHALAGLTMLADWIASSDWQNSPPPERLEQWADGRLAQIGLNPSPWRDHLASMDFRAAFGFPSSPAQAAFATTPGSLAILESETGSGKTEAALWRFVERFRAGAVDGLYFALPTRSAATELHARVARLVATLWPGDRPPVVLAVPGYLNGDIDGALPPAHDNLDQAEGDARDRPVWASEHPKRYFAGLIAVGTIDQALLAILRTRHAHLRGAALMRLMLVIDEVHASDAYMSALTEELLADHLAAGGEAALLSATLGARARLRYASIGMTVDGNLRAAETALPPLAEAARLPYPAITVNSRLGGELTSIAATGRDKRIEVEVAGLIDDADAIAARAAVLAAEGAKVLVVRNTVAGAVAVQMALEQRLGMASPLLFRVEGVPTLHHGRFAREDRLLLDHAVETAVGKARLSGGLVLVGTQTLEQSLDIDADYLVTDLSPIDVLLQRLGRLHRHPTEPDGHTPRRRPKAAEQPRALVLVPVDGLADLLSRRRSRNTHGLGPIRDDDGALRGVYPDLVTLELTRRLCAERPLWTIPADNRDLVEHVLHPEARDAFFASLPDSERALWRHHDNEIAGTGHTDGATARLSVLDRDKPFMHADNFIHPDEQLATRLGEAGEIIDLPDGTIGPFGRKIQKIAIPSRWYRCINECNKLLRVENHHFWFTLGNMNTSYGRHGLLRTEE